MINQPKKIYLNIGADGECQDFEELVGVSWSDSRITDDDLEYISVSSVLARIEELEAEVENEDSVYSEASCRFKISELKNLIKL
jgi:uncharacterized small protein (DUF1192 family)